MCRGATRKTDKDLCTIFLRLDGNICQQDIQNKSCDVTETGCKRLTLLRNIRDVDKSNTIEYKCKLIIDGGIMTINGFSIKFKFDVFVQRWRYYIPILLAKFVN